jgi:hypothetical protein
MESDNFFKLHRSSVFIEFCLVLAGSIGASFSDINLFSFTLIAETASGESHIRINNNY